MARNVDMSKIWLEDGAMLDEADRSDGVLDGFIQILSNITAWLPDLVLS